MDPQDPPVGRGGAADAGVYEQPLAGPGGGHGPTGEDVDGGRATVAGQAAVAEEASKDYLASDKGNQLSRGRFHRPSGQVARAAGSEPPGAD